MGSVLLGNVRNGSKADTAANVRKGWKADISFTEHSRF